MDSEHDAQDGRSKRAPRGVRHSHSNRDVRLELEPVGVLVGSRGLLARSVGAALPALALTVAVVLSALPQLDSPIRGFVNGGGLALIIFVLGCLWIFVALMTLHAVDLGRRRTLIGVVDGTLLVERRGAFGTKRITIARDELVRIEAGAHFAVLHQRGLPCLVVERRGAAPLHLLAERSASDLEWIAAALRPALGLPSEPSDQEIEPLGAPFDGDDEALASR